MAKTLPDQIGRLAEAIAIVQFAKFVGTPYNRPLFRATLLGEKYPAADMLVDVIGPRDETTGLFFLQIKGTAIASLTAPRIAIDVSLERFNRLVQLPAPSYLLVVDTVSEQAYLCAASKSRNKAVASVTKAFPLGEDRVKIGLYREVCGFWKARRLPKHISGFGDG